MDSSGITPPALIACVVTQKDQDEEDDDTRKRAMKDLVQSWMDRLQLISVIVSIVSRMLAPY